MDYFKVPESIPKTWYYISENLGHHIVARFKVETLYSAAVESKLCRNTKEHSFGSRYRYGLPCCHDDYCNGILPWFANYCMCCGKSFIRDFRVAKYCDRFPTCWDCTQLHEWDMCPDHGYDKTKFGMKYFEPTGANPRDLTEEELNELGVVRFEF